MADWLEHTVQIEVPVSIEFVWSLWSDLEQMTIWMKWIESVKILEDNPELSRWKLASGNFNFTWLSRIVQVVPQQIIEWQSVDGLPNKGAIRFYARKDNTSIVKMTFAYAVPGIIGKLMDSLIGNIVESTVMADLERFKEYAIKAYAESE
ncbi:SRPBCC family protein [Pleurocapsa sp. FMAR1]|uniref:SRPBCC family protein n=1 Tax=Pleurocapsa sp. FMAR1 TaxID=3040204 RepID=UPI0029C70C82|nr:SRPBCC family protein [Pleurocapsa sp. FMAR1]